MSNTLRNTIRTINRLRKEAHTYTKSDPERACTLLEKAHALTKNHPFPTRALLVAKARILHVLAYCYHMENQLDTALSHVSQAAELFQRTAEVNEYIKAVNLMQIIHHNKGDYLAALELLQSCLQLENKAVNRQLMGKIQGNIGILFCTLGNPQKAMPHFQQALLIAEECKNYPSVCLALTNIALCHTFAGKMLPALECLLKAVSIAEKLGVGKERTMGRLCMHIGDTLRLLGNYDQALAYLLRSLALLEKHGSRMEVGFVLRYIGHLSLDTKEHDSAKTYLLRALDIHDGRNGSQQARMTGKMVLAQVELALGNTGSAHNHAMEVLHISEATNDRQKKSDALAMIAAVYKEQRDYTAARMYYQRSLDAYGVANNVHARVPTLVGIGKILMCQQHYEEALEYLHTARRLAEQTDNTKPVLLSVYQALADVYEQVDDTKRALEHFKLFHDIDKQIFNEKAEQNRQVLTMLHHVEQIEKENALQKQDNKQLQQNIEQVQNALTVHVLHLAQQTDLLQKAKGEISGVITQQLPVLQKGIRSTMDALAHVCPHTKTQKVSAKNALLHIADTLSSIEKEALGNMRESLQSIIHKFDNALLAQGMWQAFEQQFQQINSGFMETLVRRYPQLSTTEIKVCSLIKINLSSKEIGHMLNVSLRSVETYRYNIRKKLGLAAKDNLTQFIAELP